ncbi:MAG: ATP synthase subunit I [Proteobacteria bacterium]|nr:MAG: ATP synthase subunit I [Pseudomonadota bacterium]QKK12135.1 MAG: ATP synthase subunit I [Pseudomonadota bacterium]
MNDWLTLALAGLAGLVLSALSFGGLWWTVRLGVVSRRPALLFLGSLLLRTAVVVTGFYFVGDGDWRRLLACLVGFVVARSIITRLAGPPLDHFKTPVKEAGHAP